MAVLKDLSPSLGMNDHKDDGIVVLTLDYPTIDLYSFQSLVREAGLALGQEADFTLPPDALHTGLWGG